MKRSLGIPGFQLGGRIPGYGGGDKVPALLEKGEFVVRKEVAREYGDVLENINRGENYAIQDNLHTTIGASLRNTEVDRTATRKYGV
jgi:hypothetical protein